jgi:hypothetical protein
VTIASRPETKRGMIAGPGCQLLLCFKRNQRQTTLGSTAATHRDIRVLIVVFERVISRDTNKWPTGVVVLLQVLAALVDDRVTGMHHVMHRRGMCVRLPV